MKKPYDLIVYLLIVVQSIGVAQNKNIKAYQTASVTRSAGDDGVSLWTGTGRGIVQINKETNETTIHRNIGGLRDTAIELIKISPNGDIWAGTRAGVARYKNGEWQGWEFVSKKGKSANTITDLCFDKTGGVWIAAGTNPFTPGFAFYDTTHVVGYFNGLNWKIYDISDWKEELRITNLASAIDGSVWGIGGDVNYSKSIAIHWTKPEMKIFTSTDAPLPPIQLQYSSLTGLLTDNSGGLWIGSGTGISNFDGANWKFYKRFTSSKPADSLRSGGETITVDNKGTVWAGGSTGLSSFSNGKWKKYGISEKIHYSYRPVIKEILIDKSDSVWCLTDGALLCLVNDSLMRVKLPPGFLETEMRGLALSYDGNLLLCGGGSNSGDKGVVIRKNGAWKMYRNTAEPIVIDNIEVDKAGNVWGTGTRGITRFNGKKWDYWGTSTGMSDTNFAIVADKSNNVWITNYNGVSKFDGVKWTSYKLSDKDHWREYFSSITVDSSNNIWISNTPYDSVGTYTFEGVEYVNINPDTTRLHKYSVLTNSWEVINLPKERTIGVVLGKQSLATDHTGEVWLAPEVGIGGKEEVYTLYRFSSNSTIAMYDLQNNGFDSTRSRGGAKILFDGNGKMWVGYRHSPQSMDGKPERPGGIAQFDGASWSYEIYDTLQFLDVQSLKIDPVGSIWTTTTVKRNNIDFSGVYVKKNNIWREYNDVDRLGRLTFDQSGNMWAIRAGTEIVKISNAYTVGIEEENPTASSTEISLYPNPVRDYIDIRSVHQHEGDFTIQITSLLGQTIAEQRDFSSVGVYAVRIPLINIASGVYFVTIKNNGQCYTRMFVKE